MEHLIEYERGSILTAEEVRPLVILNYSATKLGTNEAATVHLDRFLKALYALVVVIKK
jgi:hypothetical protein